MTWRDMSKPYTHEEFLEKRQLFVKLPTYKSDGDEIIVDDIEELCKIMGYKRSPEQIEAYKDFWTKNMGGKVTWDETVKLVSKIHETKLFAKEYANVADRDKNGFISADEFSDLLKLMKIQDPSLAGKTYADFVKEADVNLDSKVSIEECADWIEKYLH